MDYRNILATGFLLLCGAVFVHSLKSANAFPQGPNVSMGSNPIENFYSNCNNQTMYTNNTSQTFIITDVIHGVSNYGVELNINGIAAYKSVDNGHGHFISGLRVEPSESVICYSASNVYGATISGYYTH